MVFREKIYLGTILILRITFSKRYSTGDSLKKSVKKIVIFPKSSTSQQVAKLIVEHKTIP